MNGYAFGLAPRKHYPSVPLWSTLSANNVPAGAVAAAPAPVAHDWTAGMPKAGTPSDFGEMGNHNLNDCTCAAYYHARQVWTYVAAGTEITETDAVVATLYQEACNYNPAAGPPGPSAAAQDVLTYIATKGAPIAGGDGKQRDFLTAFVEIDHTRYLDIKNAIFDCGIVFVGFPRPTNVTSDNPVWDYDRTAPLTADGHAVVLAGYDDNGAIGISWGKRHTLTWDFIGAIVDEAYALVDKSWLDATQKTPAGLTLAQLQAAMKDLNG